MSTTPREYNFDKLNERFDHEAPAWHKLYDPVDPSIYNNKQYRRKYVLEMLGSGSGTVLDFGCGAGGYFEVLEKLGYHVVGLDSAPQMVKTATNVASSLKNTKVLQGDVLHPPFEKHTFDALIAVGLLEYLPNDQNFLRVVKELVKPGGKIVVTLRNSRCFERRLWKLYLKFGINVGNIDYFYRDHDAQSFTALLKAHGFKDVQVRYCHFYPVPWPIHRLIPSINTFLSHKMERYFSQSKINFLGSTMIVSFRP